MGKRIDTVRTSVYDQFNPAKGKVADNQFDTRMAVMQRMYSRILTELCANRFEWSGLPENVDVRYLELELYYRSLAVFTFDEKFDKYLVLRGAGIGQPNMQDNPTAFTVIGSNYPQRVIRAANCVPIWSNYLRTPDHDIVSNYAYRLANADITVDIGLDNTRAPVALVVSENMRLSASNMMRQIRQGNPTIEMNAGTMDLADSVVPINLGGDAAVVEKVHIVRARLWNECMGLLGLNNANQDKKERLVASEVDANDEQVSLFKRIALNARRKAADEINEKYDLNVGVKFADDVNVLVSQAKAALLGVSDEDEESEEEGEDDGDVHN